jgi:N-acetyl-anhydromuramyl-L-alanine amidase AmpD
MNITSVLSPNFTQGRRTYRPEAVVIHVMDGTLKGTDSWFSSPLSQVSAHYGIGRNGEVHQYVEEIDTAWHAGRIHDPTWPLIKKTSDGMYINPNYYTIGIEHEGNEQSEWTDTMYATSAEMIRKICQRWSIPADRLHIIGHHEIYSLKNCPGLKVDMDKLIALVNGSTQHVNGQISKTEKFGKVTTLTRLNLRAGPGKVYKITNMVNAGIQLAYDGFTMQGETVNGNGKWFYTEEGNWFWSGGVK